jgi:uncharacterized protein (DUF1697 family)
MESVMSTDGLKYYKRLKIYKSSTGNVVFNPETLEARSYDWWVFVSKIKGKVVFNNYPYSTSTGGHQRAVKKLLQTLGIKIDVTVSVRQSLNDISHEALAPLYRNLAELQVANKRRGVKADTIKYRNERISEIEDSITVLRSLGAKFSQASKKRVKEEVLRDEAYRLERMRKESEEKREYTRLARKEAKDILNNSFINV